VGLTDLLKTFLYFSKDLPDIISRDSKVKSDDLSIVVYPIFFNQEIMLRLMKLLFFLVSIFIAFRVFPAGFSFVRFLLSICYLTRRE